MKEIKELRNKIRRILKESKHGMMFGQEMGETRSPEEIAKSMLLEAIENSETEVLKIAKSVLLEAIENSETEVFNHPDGPGGIMFKLPNSSTVIEVNYTGKIECK